MATVLVSMEEYLKSSFDPDAEYIDGKIVERPMGEDSHSAWQEALCAWFRQQKDSAQVRVRPELRVQVNPTNFLVPDVAILDRNQPTTPIATHPPIAVFEVLSPEDRVGRMLRKYALYEKMGIQTILVIDPDGPVQLYSDGALKPLEQRSFIMPGSAARFDLDEIIKLVD